MVWLWCCATNGVRFSLLRRRKFRIDMDMQNCIIDVHNFFAQKSPFLHEYSNKKTECSYPDERSTNFNVSKKFDVFWLVETKLTLQLVHNLERSRITSLNRHFCQCWFKLQEKIRKKNFCRSKKVIKNFSDKEKMAARLNLLIIFERSNFLVQKMSWLWILWSLESSIRTIKGLSYKEGKINLIQDLTI